MTSELIFWSIYAIVGIITFFVLLRKLTLDAIRFDHGKNIQEVNGLFSIFYGAIWPLTVLVFGGMYLGLRASMLMRRLLETFSSEDDERIGFRKLKCFFGKHYWTNPYIITSGGDLGPEGRDCFRCHVHQELVRDEDSGEYDWKTLWNNLQEERRKQW